MPHYYGKQTEAAIGNFPFGGPRVSEELIRCIAIIKKAAAYANASAGLLDGRRARAIARACEEIIARKLKGEFPLPALQGGAGTSIHMNVNEVVASRASEMLRAARPKKDEAVHPNDHVNKGQSSNDVNPSALRIAALRIGKAFVASAHVLVRELERQGRAHKNVLKLGRTHLQDAVPTTVGAEFYSWAAMIRRDIQRVEEAFVYCLELNLGGTAIGNSANASPQFIEVLYRRLRVITRLDVRPAPNLMSQTSSHGDFVALMSAVEVLMMDVSKIADDLRILGSGPRGGIGEFSIPELQPGSSIMPGKANPILPESVNQVYCFVSGNARSVREAAGRSELELNVHVPMIAQALLSSLELGAQVIQQFAMQCISRLVVNRRRCLELLERSTAYATFLVPRLGYDTVSQLVREAVRSNRTVQEVVVGKKLLSKTELNAILKKASHQYF